MTASESYFDTEERGLLGILRLKPHAGVALADLSYSRAIVNAIRTFESTGKRVLLVSFPAGNLAPERLGSFWESARQSPADPGTSARHKDDPTSRAISMIGFENSVRQLLEMLQSTNLFKIVSVEGDVDFDLLGLLLAFDIRFCGRKTSFENRIIERGAVPGFGVAWYLARYLGPPTSIDLILNRRNLSAEEAHQLGLITQLCDGGSAAETACEYAEQLAARPAMVLATLAHATKYLECDFQEYLKQVGAGFTQIPSD